MMKKLYYNGTVLTMDTPLYAEAVCTENGRICGVGKTETLLSCCVGKEAEKIDLAGRTLMPAFLDAHSHFSAVANAQLQAPLDEAYSFSDIEERIRAFVSENNVKPGEWVIAKGYDHNQLAEKKHPAAKILDIASPENPLVIQHKSGHMGVFNTRALEMLGITSETESPAGGLIEKTADGQPTGYMEETAFVSNLQRIPMPDFSALLAAYETAQRKYASYGITTVQEGFFAEQLAPLYRGLLEKKRLWLDVVGYADAASGDALLREFPKAVKQYDRHFKLGGYKMFLDGSPQGRTAWMRTPYRDAPDYFGYGTLSDAKVREFIRLAFAQQMQILAHCNGDAAAGQYIDAVAELERQKMDVAALRPVIIHAQLLGRDQLPRVRSAGLLPSFFVAHVYHWGDVHIENFGRARADEISPAASALGEGIQFTFHQDAPVIEPDMIETVWCAVNRKTKAGEALGASERISTLEALRAVTRNAAYQYFEEDEKGSIRNGKRADFVILDRDPLKTDPAKLREVRVLETIKDGNTIYKA